MRYTGNSHIASIDEVKAFASYLVNDLGANLHSDKKKAKYYHEKVNLPQINEEKLCGLEKLL